MQVIRIYKAKGGAGATTIATALALRLSVGIGEKRSVRLVDPTGDAASALGVSERELHLRGERVLHSADAKRGETVATVIDGGLLPDLLPGEPSDTHLLVIRPEYAALRLAVASNALASIAGLVYIADSDLVLGECEVADVLGIPIIASSARDAAVMRVSDAGLLCSHRSKALAESISSIVRYLARIEEGISA